MDGNPNTAIKEAIKRAKMEGARGALITSGRRIAETANNFKKNTSVGLDLWAIKEFGQCAPEDLDRLAELLMEWDMEITAPAQWLVNLMAMIHKKNGHRTVATMASGYRVYAGLYDEGERQWNVGTHMRMTRQSRIHHA